MEKLSWIIWSYYIKFINNYLLRSNSWLRKLCERIAIAFDTKIRWHRCILGENTTLPCDFTFYKALFKQAPKHVYLISKGESSKRNKINSENTLKYFHLLLLLNMKFACRSRSFDCNLVPRLFPLRASLEERPWSRLVTCLPDFGR
jgi:hypothetical protein